MEILNLIDSEQLRKSLILSSFKDMNGNDVVPLEAIKNAINALRYKNAFKTPSKLIFENTCNAGEYIVNCVIEIAVLLQNVSKEDLTDNFNILMNQDQFDLELRDDQWSTVGELMDCCSALCKENNKGT